MDQSFNDLKFQLQQELQKEGMVENMKTQLRYKLLERLQMQQKRIPTTDKVSESEMLLKRVLASAVADYLREAKMDYSLSVFVPETTFGAALLNKEELKILLRMDNQQGSILQQMFSDILLLKPKEALKSNAATQTFYGDAVINLEQKLSMVDNMYKSKIENELMKPQYDMEERIQKMKREYDQRLKTEIATETARIREFEVQHIRLEEADKYRQKLQDYREELEKNFQEKLNVLRERENDTLKMSAQKTKELESLNYQYRQKILKEHEMIKLKEQEIEKQRIANEESLKFQKAKLDVMERDLSKKLAEANGNEDVIRRKYEAQIHAAKATAETEFYEEREQIRNKLKQLEGDLRNMDNLKNTIKTLQRENEQLVEENKKYVEQVREVKKRRKEMEYEYEQMKENLRAVSDAQRRDQELCRKYETDIRLKEEEMTLYKTTINHKDGMLNDHKVLQQEQIKKLQKEIEQYQKKVEAQELLIKDLQVKENHSPNFDIQSALFKGNIADSQLMQYNFQDHSNKMKQINNELDENRMRRREEIKRLQENAVVSLNTEPALKFDNVWDVYNSSVNYSQVGGLQYRSKLHEDYQGGKIFQTGEDAQSQVVQSGVFQKKPGQGTNQQQQNIIEETYSELM
ncbi:unnamed protein product [Paramecium sonneborni]|uniref:LisH domain-containing protein n=1 Tax=Paramecium sonneborni TaxID=65129 RepID=A0A8S1KEH5_9CILI|nr:unnamed protein product [Paramecium sonneborni]